MARDQTAKSTAVKLSCEAVLAVESTAQRVGWPFQVESTIKKSI